MFRESIARIVRRMSPDAAVSIAAPVWEDDILEVARAVAPFTMTSTARIAALCDAVRYVVKYNIPGSFVECGVWRGGSMMAVAHTLLGIGITDRALFLYDTYDGMPEPDPHDISFDGTSARDQLAATPRVGGRNVWAIAGRDDVEQNVATIGYPMKMVNLIEGRVEDTLPARAPAEIAILRLDTDWYSSTKHELVHLVPRIAPGGVLIVDDYGHWRGAQQAVDEYLKETGLRLLLNRIDYTGRIGVLPSS